jgi:hypothetical protein
LHTKRVENALSYLTSHKSEFEYAAQNQIELWNNKKPNRQPILLSCSLDQETSMIPRYNEKETHYDSEKMFVTGLRGMMSTALACADGIPSLRANMGCGIFPTLFGVKQLLFDDKMPWVKDHLSKEVLAKMGPEDLKIGHEFKAGLEHMQYMAERISGTGCMVFPMDLQGAFDTAHIVYGDAIFYDIYDDPGFVHHLLELSCQAIIMGMEECLKVMPDSNERIAHYNNLVMPRSKGGIKLSEDTSTLLSKEHIEEFVVPYMHKLLSHFGGGYVHYCGKNPHLFEAVMKEPYAFGLNFGNPEMHETEYVLNRCAEAGMIYYGAFPKMNDESLEQYFERQLKASKIGDRSMLLLQYGCNLKDREKVLEAWERSCKRVFADH